MPDWLFPLQASRFSKFDSTFGVDFCNKNVIIVVLFIAPSIVHMYGTLINFETEGKLIYPPWLHPTSWLHVPTVWGVLPPLFPSGIWHRLCVDHRGTPHQYQTSQSHLWLSALEFWNVAAAKCSGPTKLGMLTGFCCRQLELLDNKTSNNEHANFSSG